MKTALEFIKEIDEEGQEWSEDTEVLARYFDDYAKLYHEDKTSWISVSERLPEIEILERNDINNSLPVIAILKNGEVYKMVLSHWYEDDPNVFNWVYSDSGEIESNVTHWQPLPKLTQNKV